MPPSRWGLAALLGAASGACILRNAWVLLHQVTGDKRYERRSLIPMLGGFLGSWAVYAAPWPAWRAYAWAPFVIDPGCGVFLMFFFFLIIRRRLEQRG